ncbi:MAG: phosphoribosyl-ATP diphosphatase [Oscillospiraceae bacterium]
MKHVFTELYKVIEDRRDHPQEGSYTCYLFDKGLDKILKKVGEECAETIIAAKNGNKEETVGEISDLFYHILVMMVNEGIPLTDVTAELDRRGQKIGNLKTFHVSDHES